MSYIKNWDHILNATFDKEHFATNDKFLGQLVLKLWLKQWFSCFGNLDQWAIFYYPGIKLTLQYLSPSVCCFIQALPLHKHVVIKAEHLPCRKSWFTQQNWIFEYGKQLASLYPARVKGSSVPGIITTSVRSL